ncbi:hypothetical protein GCM10025857_30460 [Alicyclobacillus contaminans]|nr:hypothetical protein GCM10025857_30460 [Alicyclobacillus contaminans]
MAEFSGSFEEMWDELMAAREVLLPHIQDSLPLIQKAIRAEQHVLLEGQLGVMRDLDWGTYPFVTSSNPIAGATSVGAGIPPPPFAALQVSPKRTRRRLAKDRSRRAWTMHLASTCATRGTSTERPPAAPAPAAGWTCPRCGTALG